LAENEKKATVVDVRVLIFLLFFLFREREGEVEKGIGSQNGERCVEDLSTPRANGVCLAHASLRSEREARAPHTLHFEVRGKLVLL
jgi:hypothetical protein